MTIVFLFAAVPIQLATTEEVHAAHKAAARDSSHLNDFARPKKTAAS
jgi:hypothetical protein